MRKSDDTGFRRRTRRIGLAGPLLVLASGWGGPCSAAEGLAAPAPALGMAVPLPDPGMANGTAGPLPPADDTPAPPAGPPPAPATAPAGVKRPRGLGSGFAAEQGQLPHQRTGRRHEHVVRDICIGC